jgi:hypothetical protein
VLDAPEPERRLSDPEIAFQHERTGQFSLLGDEGAKIGSLLVSPDDVDHRFLDRDRAAPERNADRARPVP